MKLLVVQMKNKKRSRISLKNVAETSEEKINSQEFLNSARQRPQDFTRNRKMPFAHLVMFMLNMIKSSIQNCLDSYFERTGQLDIHMKEQSFSEARQKIKWEAFRDLFKTIVNLIYTGYFETWHGYRVSAIDGTKLQIPDDQYLREYFGTLGKDNTAATAQASALYDVYNKVLLDVQFEPLKIGERELASRHIDELCKLPSFGKECILFDRGYASFMSVEKLIGCNIHFVMRVKRGFNKSIDQLVNGDHSIYLQKRGHHDIKVRVLKFTLPSGDVETLITDITDKRMGINAFKQLYFKRWPIETKYDEIKNKLEVENFSGLTVDAIRQDFFVTMYMANVAAVACWEAQQDVDEERELKENKYSYHVNVNHAIGTLKDRFILAMLEPNPRIRRRLIRRIIFLLKECTPVPTRPGRSVSRNPSPRKAKFRHNRKSNC
jgi:hypothetical protein